MFYPQRNKIRRFYIFAAIFILFVVLINFPFVRQTRIAAFSRTVILNVFYPFQYTADAIFSRIFGIGDLINAAKENKELKRDLAEAKIKTLSLDVAASENERLRDLLDFKFAKSSFDNRPKE
ncbi:MAG: hypothetical protein NT030_05110, partial [Candidatus Saganbacteria bacterium]|nr:hypothetical protein [Candidatus Saganbacteria bacterium]